MICNVVLTYVIRKHLVKFRQRVYLGKVKGVKPALLEASKRPFDLGLGRVRELRLYRMFLAT